MKKIKILVSNTTNPWFNLATEDWIFRNLEPDTHTLFLWRNADTVVIGCHQNPWVECKTEKMEQAGVFLARRQSGGGAVFHDLGNTNFTFLSPSTDYDQETNFSIITDALAKLGIQAEKSGRNDLTVKGLKVSGSAFKHTTDRKFHHGTLLVNTNMNKLAQYLNPNKRKLDAKGIKSVRSRVANLVEFNESLNHELICNAIMQSFCEHHQQTIEPELLDTEILKENDHLNHYYDLMSDWGWRYGKTPDFSHFLEEKFDWGLISLHLNVSDAKVQEAVVFSDALDTEFIAQIQNLLTGITYNSQSFKTALSVLSETPHWVEPSQQLSQWIEAAISQ